MGKKQLLKQLRSFFDMGKKRRLKHMQDLEAIIKEIKTKEKKLIAKCQENPTNNESRMIKHEIAILHAKRKKGLKALKELRDLQNNLDKK